MARLHSKKKGKSGRKTPKSKLVPEWVKADKKYIEEEIIKLAKEGTSPSKIGIILRDKHGIPEIKPFLGTKLSVFLRKNKVGAAYPDDFLALLKRAVRMNRHLKNAKKDVHNKTKYVHIISKINRLAKYLKAKGILPEDWKYDPEQAELLVK
ncbi:MAG: 30S ribosomal protein S15 [Candidatus Bilamarchaeaceae archaeon]